MSISVIEEKLEQEISRLQQALAVLRNGTGHVAATRQARKRSAANDQLSPTGASVSRFRRRKHQISEEGRKRIAEAQKRRWAAARAAAKE